MEDQLKAVKGIIANPKDTLRRLPSDRLYLLAIVSPMYLGIAKAYRPRNYALLSEKLGGDLQIILFGAALSLLLIPVGGWITQRFIGLFKKRLSIRKLLNINGYSQVPRLAVGMVGNVMLIFNPEFIGEGPTSLRWLILVISGALALLYSTFLLVYGIVVCPSESEALPNQAL